MNRQQLLWAIQVGLRGSKPCGLWHWPAIGSMASLGANWLVTQLPQIHESTIISSFDCPPVNWGIRGYHGHFQTNPTRELQGSICSDKGWMVLGTSWHLCHSNTWSQRLQSYLHLSTIISKLMEMWQDASFKNLPARYAAKAQLCQIFVPWHHSIHQIRFSMTLVQGCLNPWPIYGFHQQAHSTRITL